MQVAIYLFLGFQPHIELTPNAVSLGTGIGRATSLALAKDGFKIALVGRRKEKLDAVAAELGGDSLILPADVGNPQQVQTVFETIKSTWGVGLKRPWIFCFVESDLGLTACCGFGPGNRPANRPAFQ